LPCPPFAEVKNVAQTKPFAVRDRREEILRHRAVVVAISGGNPQCHPNIGGARESDCGRCAEHDMG
ncbi:hypothetical protein KEM55_001452, partial [Ascosphaera atra]